MRINLPVKIKKDVDIKTIKFHLKLRDDCCFTLYDKDDTEILVYDGYVPDFLPGEFGDYLYLNIDIDTGFINNWNISSTKLRDFVKEQQDNDDDK